jgi:hypothetical protein
MVEQTTVKPAEQKEVRRIVTIKPPNLQVARFEIEGLDGSPLVIHRFSQKMKAAMLATMMAGSTRRKGKAREPFDPQATYEGARYRHADGWDGFNASSIRAAMISACRLVGFKMTLAKLSLFTIQDGWDVLEPEIPLIRIYGEPRRLESVAHVETGAAYITVRPCYDKWSAKPTIRFDADQFTLEDVTNLLARVGAQVGIGEGRPDSKNSAGMGWGMFRVKGNEEVK